METLIWGFLCNFSPTFVFRVGFEWLFTYLGCASPHTSLSFVFGLVLTATTIDSAWLVLPRFKLESGRVAGQRQNCKRKGGDRGQKSIFAIYRDDPSTEEQQGV